MAMIIERVLRAAAANWCKLRRFCYSRRGGGSAMTPNEFGDAVREVYGKKRWRQRLGDALGRDRSTIYRWANGSTRVPEYVVNHLEAAALAKRRE